jgi:toxin ParE1/3/4
LDDAIAYYEERRVGLGIEFLRQVEQATAQIEREPGLGAPYQDSEYRHYIVRRFPYVLYYVEREDAIWIIAVAHGSRRPSYWMSRRIE